MTRLPRARGKEVVRALQRIGFVTERTRGSHVFLKHPDGRVTTVPTSAGRVLARLARKFDYEIIGRGRLTNDALLAMSAARCGGTIITANERDFARLSQFRRFHWLVQQPTSP